MIKPVTLVGLIGLLWISTAMAADPEGPATIGSGPASPMPQGLEVQTSADAVTYSSSWLKVSFSLHEPTMTFLSVDSTGMGRHERNLLKAPVGAGPAAATLNCLAKLSGVSCDVSVSENVLHYTNIKLGGQETDSLTFTIKPKSIGLVIDRDIPRDYDAFDSSPFRMLFDVTVTPASPLGRVKADEVGVMQFPVLLHFPDCGSLLVRSKDQDADADAATWEFSLFKGMKPATFRKTASNSPGAVAGWRVMTDKQREEAKKIGNRYRLNWNHVHNSPDGLQLALQKRRDSYDGDQEAGKQHIELEMAVTAIYPEAVLVDADPKLIGVKRAWLNIFGFRADLACLANSSTGDTPQYCLYEYADQAYWSPPLFDDFTPLDLVRISLDRYCDGFVGFTDRFQDVAPSTIIAAWDYVVGKPDVAWLKRRMDVMEKYAELMISRDVDGDGLVETEGRSSNWWDAIDWSWKDAYSSALSYRAFRCMADLERRVGNDAKVKRYTERADKIKAVFYKTFYNPETGVIAGWRTKDGKLRDCYFLWASGIAISYGLIDKPQANAILDRLQAKLKEVGFNSYQYGLPGNLVPFPNDTLTFQLYENGGVTGSMAYHYIQALYSVGRKAEADAILNAMLDGYRDGTFQNGIGNGGDWKEWNGAPTGYEGLLVDAYYPLTALITGRLGRGVPIP